MKGGRSCRGKEPRLRTLGTGELAKVTLERRGSCRSRWVAGLTFLCTTSCQLMLRKNLCSMTSLASLGPPPSLGREGHEHPPPRPVGSGQEAFSAGPAQPLVILSRPQTTLKRRKPRLREGGLTGPGSEARELATWTLSPEHKPRGQAQPPSARLGAALSVFPKNKWAER